MSGFDAGVFTVGASGTLNFDYLFDGGSYQGQLAIFNLQGMEQYTPGSTAFIQEAARRGLTASNLGHVVLNDITTGAKFFGTTPWEGNSNSGTYSGIKTVTMNPGDQFGLMLVPNNTIQYIYDNPTASTNGARPLFSLGTPSTSDTLTGLQMVDVIGNNTAFAWEDIRFDSSFSDHDYNDVIFQMTGAASNNTLLLNDKINLERDWRTTPVGQKIISSLYFPPSIELREGNNFTTSWSKTFELPPGTSQLSFTIDNLSFDTTDGKSMKDAFEAALVDENGNSLVHTVGIGKNAFFNYTEGQSPALATGVTFSNKIVTLNLSALPKGTQAKLILRLVNNDRDVNTIANISNLAIPPNSTFTPPVAVPVTADSTAASEVDFSKLSDVSNSITATYGQTSFNEDTDTLYTDLAVKNAGQYSVKKTLLVGVTNISDPNVRLLNADGTTPAGISYVDFSNLLPAGTLAPTLSTAKKTILFDNPNGVQFTYDLVFLSQVNSIPEFTTNPDIEAIVGKPYIYDVDAEDADKDSLTYSLLSAPDGLAIDSATGKITWNPTASDIGNHNIIIKVKDNFGGETTQQYNLSTINPPPNRPPIFTSIPTVDASVNTPYKYEAKAKDDDGNPLTFSLVEAPVGMSVNPNTGVINWVPDGNQVGKVNIKLKVEDGAGGTAEQTYQILTQIEPGNTIPEIISQPITRFGVIGNNNNSTITLNTTVRDFKVSHPDFEEWAPGFTLGMVQNQLGADKIPVFSGPNGKGGVTSAETFNQWYRDVPDINIKTTIPLVLTETYSGSGIYRYSNNDFFPIDNKLFGNEGYSHNYHFTLDLHTNFTYKGGENFKFTGDDDIWVFINNKLAVDLGGVHSALSGEVNLDTLGLTRGETYPIDFFFAERHTFGSSFDMETGLNFKPSRQYVYQLQTLDADSEQLTYKLLTAPNGMQVNDKGTITWNPKPSQVGIYPVSVEVRDGRGGVTTQSFNLEITANGTGQIQGTLFDDANADGQLNTGETKLSGRQVYIDENLNQQYDSDEISAVTDNTGNYSFTNLPEGIYNLAQVLPGSWRGTTNFRKVMVASNQITTGIDFGSIQLVPGTPNRNPNFVTSASQQNVRVGQLLRYDAKAIDLDVDNLTYDLVVKPEGMTVDSNTGTVVWRPTSEQIGTSDVTLRVFDGNGGVDLQSFQVQVAPANYQPIITSTPVTRTRVGVPYQYRLSAQDADFDSISFRLENPPSGMQVDGKGVVSWTPNQEGDRSVKIIASDGKGGEATQTYTLKVVGATDNTNPIITSTPRKDIGLGDNYFYQVEVDNADSDPLTYALETHPDGMSIDNEGRISWQPTATQFGDNNIKIKVSDGRGGFDIQEYTVKVVSFAANQSPQIDSTPNLTATVSSSYQYNLAGSDPDGDLLLWSLDFAPRGMSIDPERGTIRWTPTAEQVGEHEVAVRVMDSLGAYVGQAFTVKVRGVNVAPTITSTPPTAAAVNKAYKYVVLAKDLENDKLQFSLNNPPSGMTINRDTGLIEWTPNNLQVGEKNVEVIVEDSEGATTKQNYKILVKETAENLPPAITSTPKNVAAVNQNYRYAVTATDPEGETPLIQLLEKPDGMTFNQATGQVEWKPNSTQTGVYSVTIAATDSSGAGGVQQFDINVVANQIPQIISTPVESVTLGKTYRYDVKATDGNGDALVYSLTNPVTGMAIDSNGRITWSPTNTGAFPVNITVTDSRGASVSQTYNLNVVADNTAPKVSLRSNRTGSVDKGDEVSFVVSATDDVGVTATVLKVNNRVVPLDSQGRATVKMDTAGGVNAVATATDAAGNSGNASNSINVIDPSDNVGPDLEISSLEDDAIITAPINIIGTVNDSSLSYYRLLVSPVDGGEFTEVFRGTSQVNNGVLGKFDPSVLGNDSYVLKLEAADSNGNISSVERVVNVAGELKLGNFRLSFTDLEIPVAGIPINVTRTYDSLNANSKDDFGYGWRLEFRDTDLRTSLKKDEVFEQLGVRTVAFKDKTRVYITLPGGKREAFTFKPTGDRLNSYFSQPEAWIYHPAFEGDKGVTSKLTVEDTRLTHVGNEYFGLNGEPYNPADSAFGGKYILTTKEGIVYEIDGVSGDLLTATDTNGNKVTFTDAGVFSDSGKAISFGRDGTGRIVSVTDLLGKQVKYQYDAKGDLVGVTDRENNTTQFVYNQPQRTHFLTEVIDPLGRRGVKNEYDDSGRLKKLFDASNNAVELIHDPNNFVETVKDVFGKATTYEYDERGNILTEIDPLGKVTKRTYDDDNNTLSETVITPETETEGWKTEFTYDGEGNKLSEKDPLGNITRYTYNQFGQIQTQTNPLGQTKTYKYDNKGNLLSTYNSIGTTKQTYDRLGNITAIIDAEGRETKFEYDSVGRVTRQIDSLGNATTYTYDANGKQLSETTTVTTTNGLQTQVKSWTYNAEGRVTSQTDPLGNVIQYEYDKLGNMTALIEKGVNDRRTEYRYDEKGQLEQTLYADGTSVRSVYDAAGREIALIDQKGQTTHFIYDDLGRLVETIYPDNTPLDLSDNPRTKTEYDKIGSAKASIDERGNRTEYEYDKVGRQTLIRDALNNETKYTYNSAGNRLTQTDARNNTTKFVYDELGRQVETHFADGTRTITTYDAVGRRSSLKDQAGHTTYFVYDALNRPIEVIHPDDTPLDLSNNPRTKTEYNELGWVTAQIDELGNRQEYEYDEKGRLVESRSDCACRRQTYTYDAFGNRISETDQLGHTTSFVYDKLNRLIETHFQDSSYTTTTYDELGRVKTQTDQAGKITKFEYDALGRLTAVVDALQQRTEYSYDKAGNLIQAKDANQHITQYEYDKLSRRTATILPLGQRSDTTYDPVGNIASTIDFNRNTITYEYDKLNRMLAKRFPDTTAVEYTYTPTGQIKTTKDQRGITTYDYDVRERLISRIDPDNQFIRYGYDAASNRTEVITPTGTTKFTYDKYNQLETVTDPNFGLTRYTYDKAGNLIRTVLPNNTVETRQYNDLNRLVFLENTGTSGVISSYRYTLDPVGNRKVVEEHDGRKVEYNYDDLYRLTQEKITDPAYSNRTINYTYDAVGNRKSSNDSVDGLTNYTYDNNDRLLSDGSSSYTYDNNGNTLSRIKDATDRVVYSWDYENRLVGANITKPSGTVQTQYKYNPDSIRVATIVNGQETRYLIDANQAYAQVWEEYTPGGAVQASYIYGNDLVSQSRGGVRSFYHVDGLGSTRALTNASGVVTDSYDYGAYGNLLGSVSNTVNNYRFAGEQFDPYLGDYYLRRRYYDSDSGRFITTDPFEGVLTEPLSRAKYPYVHGNPVNAIDPTGLFQEGELGVTLKLSEILNVLRPALPLIRFVGRTARTAGTTIFGVSLAHQANLALSSLTIRACALAGERNCEAGIPIVFYGNQFQNLPLENTTLHIKEAINYGGGIPPVLSAMRGTGDRRWLNQTPECNPWARIRYNAQLNQSRGVPPDTFIGACDEYPFHATLQGGQTNYLAGKVSLRLVPSAEDFPQMQLMTTNRLRQAGVIPGDPLRSWYGVVPIPELPESFWQPRTWFS